MEQDLTRERDRMKVEVITEEARFWQLEPTWRELQSRGAAKDLTITWEWMSTWWEVFREGRDLAVLVVREGNEAVGICPLLRRRVTHFRFIPYARLELLASGEDEEDEIWSPYLDFVILPGREREVLEAVFRYLRRLPGWHELLLPKMPADSPTVPIVLELARRARFSVEEVGRHPCLFVELPASLDDYLGQLGKRTRKRIRRDLRRLDETGDVAFKVARTEQEVADAQQALVRLHQARWLQAGKPGVFSSEKFSTFHRKMVRVAHDNGWLRLQSLLLDQEPLVCEYNLKYGGKIYSYQCGVSMEPVGNLSIGTLGEVYAIEDAIGEGLSEYDFLAGHQAYKATLANGRRELVSLRIGRNGWRETLYRTATQLRDRARHLRQAWLRGRDREGQEDRAERE
jgi:CelD/BcsL family acetyltransferase involved in cellulose biosynthesis